MKIINIEANRNSFRNSTQGAAGRTYGGKLVAIFFLVLLILLTGLNFQGLDMLDEGFHATQYQRMFSDPWSVQYTFLYWFTGFVGSLFYHVFSFMGLWGLRFAGALVTIFTGFVAYELLKKQVNSNILLISIAILSFLSIQAGPRDLYYNNLSAFLYVLSISCIAKGLFRGKEFFLLLAGLIAGINAFTRLPNILGLSLVAIIPYFSWVKKEHLRNSFRGSMIFIAGFMISIVSTILLMFLIRHVDIFISSISKLMQISNDASPDDGVNASYGIVNLVELVSMQYFRSLLYAMIAFFAILLIAVADNYLNKKNLFRKIFISLLAASVIVVFVSLLISTRLNAQKISYLFVGISIITMVMVTLDRNSSNAFKTLCFAGLLFIFIHPFGSAVGITTVVPYSLWISVPLAFQTLMSLNRLSFGMNLGNGEIISTNLFYTYKRIITKSLGIILAFIVITILYNLSAKPYFYDWHKRSEMVHGIESKNMNMIFTSKDRAQMINELLAASKKYMKSNDKVLAYDCIPLFHFMTETAPYLSNPAPFFYSSNVFSNELDNVYKNSKQLPVVVRQTVKTFEEDGSNWPNKAASDSYAGWERNTGRNDALDKFLAAHQYTMVWSNEGFQIYTSSAR